MSTVNESELLWQKRPHVEFTIFSSRNVGLEFKDLPNHYRYRHLYYIYIYLAGLSATEL